MEEIIEKLKDIGLNSYEAKVYLALLKKYPATGYEISKIADVPQARAYDTLKALEAKHVVTSSGEKPQTYSPINPKDLTKRYKRKVDNTINYLEKKLPSVKENYSEPILTLFTREQILSKVVELIKNTKKTLYIEIHSTDHKLIEAQLFEAYNRGVEIKIVGHDNLNSVFGTIYKNDGAIVIDQQAGEKMIYVLADDEECIFGKSASKQMENISAVWTKNKDLTTFTKAFIARNMYLVDIENNFGEDLRYFYGPGLKKLRDKVFY
ncbi:MAG: helix-turn-helix domain-containing protein [Candidatus Gastranaerophilales bacterium]